MEDKFDIKELQKRISEVKEESKHVNTFTQEFFQCLLERHDLASLLFEDQEFDDVPEEFVVSLKEGKIPTIEQLNMIDDETKDYLIRECVFICGMGAVAYYSDQMEEPSVFDVIMEMSNESPGHYISTYLIAGLTLLFGKIPSSDMIQMLTNDFDSKEESLEKSISLFNEMCLSIHQRYLEDLEYYRASEVSEIGPETQVPA